MEFALDGEPIAQNGRSMYAERAIHGAIYLARSDVQAVAHHHSRSVLPFTVADIPLKPLFHMGAVIGQHVPVWDSQPEFGDTNMLVDDLPSRCPRACYEPGEVRGEGAAVERAANTRRQ